MALIDLLFVRRKMQVGVLQFDASISESHKRSVAITEHPVESGGTIADHVILQPEEVEINGLVSNTPLVFLASLTPNSPIEGDVTPVYDRVEIAYAELQRIQNEGETVNIITTLREYSDMILTSLTITRDVQNGNVLNAQMSFRQIVQANVESSLAAIPTNIARVPTPTLGVLPLIAGVTAAVALSASLALLPFLGGD